MSSKFKNKYRIDSARLKGWDYSNNAAYFVTICTRNREHFFGEISYGIMSASTLGDIVEQEWLTSVALRPDMNLSLGEYVVMPNHFHGIIFIGENEFNTDANKKEMDGGMDNDIRRDAMHGVFVDQNTYHSVSVDHDTMPGVSVVHDMTPGVSVDHDMTPGVSVDHDRMYDVSVDHDRMQNVSVDHDRMQNVSVNQDAMHGVSTNTHNTGNSFGPQSKNLASIMRGFKSAVTTFARKNNLPFDWQARFHDHIIRNETEYQRITNYIINNPAHWTEDKFYGK